MWPCFKSGVARGWPCFRLHRDACGHLFLYRRDHLMTATHHPLKKGRQWSLIWHPPQATGTICLREGKDNRYLKPQNHSTKTRPNGHQARRNVDAYNSWKYINTIVWIVTLYSMQDDIMYQFEYYDTINKMWMIFKDKFVRNPITKLKRLTIKFHSYRKLYKLSMS